MKKIISILLVLTMLIPMATVVFGADSAYENKVATLSTIESLSAMNLLPSAESSVKGIVTAKIAGAGLSHPTEFDVTTSDFTQGNFLEFYMYSTKATSTKLALVLYSDNPLTTARDYYYAMIDTDFTQWKLISIPLSSLTEVHHPLGLDSVDSVCIVPNYRGSGIDYSAKFYFDDMFVRGTQTVEEDQGSQETPETYLLFDPSEGAQNKELVTIDGKLGRKWGPGHEDLSDPIAIDMPADVDLTDYKEIVFNFYSKTATYNPIHISLYAQNTDFSGSDYYYSAFNTSWGGSWQQIRLSLRYDTSGDFTATRYPTGLDKVTHIQLGATGQNLNENTETEVYLGEITLEGAAETVQPGFHGNIVIDNQYDAETMTDYVSLLKENHPNNHHPRILLTDEKLNQIKTYKDTDDFMSAAYKKVMQTANTWLQKEPRTVRIDSGLEGDTIRVNTDVLSIALNCGLAYKLTGDTRYVDRIWEEIEMMTNTETSWSGTNMLDASQATRGFALAYDWCFEYWDEYQKMVIRNALMKNIYNGALKGLRRGVGTWPGGGNKNQATACAVVLGLLAFADEPGYENFANEFMNRTFESLPIYGMSAYAPDGVYSEGASYWDLSTESFFFMTSSMITALGTDADLEDLEGLDKTGYYPFGIKGPKGVFNHSDSWKEKFDFGQPVYHYIAKRYNIPSLVSYHLSTYNDSKVDAIDLLWYDPEYEYPQDYSVGLPLDYTPASNEPMGSFRNGYGDEDYFIGFKGGNNGLGHNQNDIGSYVIDALGHRWIEDTGAETYIYTGNRYKYYRMRAEGNNCLQVNPQSGQIYDQKPALNSTDTICDYTEKYSEDNAKVAYAIFDLANAYVGDAVDKSGVPFTSYLSKYKRGFALVSQRKQFIVRDEFTAKDEPVEIYSYAHFNSQFTYEVSSDATITEVNGENRYDHSAILTAPDGKRCQVNVLTNIENLEFGVMDAVPHPSSPIPESNTGESNTGFKKFYAHSPSTEGGYIIFIYTPLPNEDSTYSQPLTHQLSKWYKYKPQS